MRCNFSSNIINVLLESILVYLNTLRSIVRSFFSCSFMEWCQVKCVLEILSSKSKRDEGKTYIFSTASTANRISVYLCHSFMLFFFGGKKWEIQYMKKIYKSPPHEMFPPNMFWLLKLDFYIFIFFSYSVRTSQYICPKLLDQFKREIGFEWEKCGKYWKLTSREVWNRFSQRFLCH